MNILVTGARAPIAVDIARALLSQGHQVWATDSFEHPLGRYTPGLRGFVRLAAPARDFAAFSAGLAEFCRTHDIGLVVPTSEEVFWLSRVQGLPTGCARFCPSPETLDLLHHKGRFAHLANELGYGTGLCHELSSAQEASVFLQNAGDSSQWVLKQVFSRFANNVLVGPDAEQVRGLSFDAHNPWLAQPRIWGQEICVYNVVRQGRVLLHQAYLPRFRAGAGASVYFEPVKEGRLLRFSRDVAEHTEFTGQMSFDVMLTETALAALECNPRGTSGVHLAAQCLPALAQSLTGSRRLRQVPYVPPKPCALHLPLMLYHPLLWGSRGGWKTLLQAKDAMRQAGIGIWPQLRATAELLRYARRHSLDPLQASTRDIEFNGDLSGEVS